MMKEPVWVKVEWTGMLFLGGMFSVVKIPSTCQPIEHVHVDHEESSGSAFARISSAYMGVRSGLCSFQKCSSCESVFV